MKINREKALAAFQEYTDRYDSSRDMIRLKIEPTGSADCASRSPDLWIFRRKRWTLRG